MYICGSLASYLWKWPQRQSRAPPSDSRDVLTRLRSCDTYNKHSVCPAIAPRAEKILQRTLSVLTDLQHAWPKARIWQASLRNAAVGLPESSSMSSMSSPPPPPGLHDRLLGVKASDSPLGWVAPGIVPVSAHFVFSLVAMR